MRLYDSTSPSIDIEPDSETKWLAFLAVYFCPFLLYLINFILIPFLIIKLAFYENNHKYSGREFSIMNKNYIYMVFSSVFVPGFTYTISLRFI